MNCEDLYSINTVFILYILHSINYTVVYINPRVGLFSPTSVTNIDLAQCEYKQGLAHLKGTY